MLNAYSRIRISMHATFVLIKVLHVKRHNSLERYPPSIHYSKHLRRMVVLTATGISKGIGFSDIYRWC